MFYYSVMCLHKKHNHKDMIVIGRMLTPLELEHRESDDD